MKENDKSTHILFSDDDTDDALLFTQAADLMKSSILLSFAEDGEQLMRYLEKESLPDMIFLDLNMPRLNGKQCLAELKKESHLANIPVIIYSTSSEKRDIEETTRLGAAHFLTKPNKFEELCKAISFVLSKDWSNNL